jgi:spore maturation protein CgeB
VFDGLNYGLKANGIDVEHYRLDTRIPASAYALRSLWREKKKEKPDLPKPNQADVMYHAGIGALEMALRLQVDVVLVVSAMMLHPDVIVMMKRAGLKVVVLFTESPYDEDHEIKIATMVDGCWTMERSSIQRFKTANRNSGYLRHAWHPLKHFVSSRSIGDLPSHDVVFVGSGFSERITWFNSIDWTGIDLGLYGTWEKLGLNKQLQGCIKGAQITNEMAASLYRRAKVNLNLYRSSKGWGRKTQKITHADSLSPRAYELAACGAFHVSDNRAEVREVFGDLVPTFSTPTEAAALIRLWLNDPEGRARVSQNLPACVAESSWVQRARTVIGDLQTMLSQRAA